MDVIVLQNYGCYKYVGSIEDECEIHKDEFQRKNVNEEKDAAENEKLAHEEVCTRVLNGKQKIQKSFVGGGTRTD